MGAGAPLKKSPKPAALRRRRRKADLAAGKVLVQKHGDPYWARNWGCECLTCTQAISKLNREQYIARKARQAAQAGQPLELRGSK